MSNQYSFVIVSTDCAELLHVNIITVKLPTGDMLLTIFFVPPKIAVKRSQTIGSGRIFWSQETVSSKIQCSVKYCLCQFYI